MRHSSSFLGYWAALFAYLMYSSMDSCIKLLGEVSTFQITAILYLCSLLIVLGYFYYQYQHWQFLVAAQSQRLWLICRGILFFGISALAFMGLQQVSLPNFYAVFFTSPLFVTILAALWLRETIHWQQLFALTVSFVGALVVCGPWNLHWQTGLFYVGLAALVHATSNVLGRHLAQHISAATNLVWTLGFGAVCAISTAFPYWQPLSVQQWQLLLLAGLFTGLANLAFTYAIYHVKAAALSVTHYSQIIWGILFGYWFWHDLPTRFTYIGTGLILMAGLIIGRYQARHTKVFLTT